jgi:hypothetical protein
MAYNDAKPPLASELLKCAERTVIGLITVATLLTF